MVFVLVGVVVLYGKIMWKWTCCQTQVTPYNLNWLLIKPPPMYSSLSYIHFFDILPSSVIHLSVVSLPDSVSCWGAVEEEHVGRSCAMWEELPRHLLPSRQLQSLHRGLHMSGRALPKHGRCVRHPRPLPLPWPGHPARGTRMHTNIHTRTCTHAGFCPM